MCNLPAVGLVSASTCIYATCELGLARVGSAPSGFLLSVLVCLLGCSALFFRFSFPFLISMCSAETFGLALAAGAALVTALAAAGGGGGAAGGRAVGFACACECADDCSIAVIISVMVAVPSAVCTCCTADITSWSCTSPFFSRTSNASRSWCEMPAAAGAATGSSAATGGGAEWAPVTYGCFSSSGMPVQRGAQVSCTPRVALMGMWHCHRETHPGASGSHEGGRAASCPSAPNLPLVGT
jgi:hypothetical protein